MTFSLRRFLVVLLMLCLPLQVFASINTVSCAHAMPVCPGMKMTSSGCCDHSKPSHHGAMDQGVNHDGHTQQDMSPCAGATTCAPVAAMAVLPSVSHVSLPRTQEVWHSSDPPSFLSFIPDSLHRPPSLVA